jgi:uncharacterized protein YbjT (DUF2867 family)
MILLAAICCLFLTFATANHRAWQLGGKRAKMTAMTHDLSKVHMNTAPSPINIVIFGATGAVGTEVIRHLATAAGVSRVTALARRALTETFSTCVSTKIVDPLTPASYADLIIGHEAAVCAFGVGQPSKVPREEFLRVDKEAVITFAAACKASGVKHFSLLGSVGANPASRSFYLKSKGELRETIAALNFERFSVFQPSVLITKTNRYDAAQAVLLKIAPVISYALIGPLRKYRSVTVERLGAAIAANLFTADHGVETLHWPEIIGLTANFEGI